MKNKLFNFIKENLWFIVSLIIIIILFNINLPFYINTPGGTININNRIDCDECNDINGSLNMLYVSEYEASIPMFLLSYIIPNWDLEKASTRQINNEDAEAIHTRGKVMLNNSVNNAIYVAYTEAGKNISVKDKKTMVIATTIDNGLEIGDEILEVDNIKINDSNDIKKIIDQKEINDYLTIKVLRDSEEKTVKSKIIESDNTKMVGVIIITDYEYITEPVIDINFKSSESGSSGGLMMALSIYTKISDKDIVKGRKIAGTGTIDRNGKVGEIDGIKYKIIGAAKDKIDIVLVPKGNYEEAIKVKKEKGYNLEIVSVDTFSDAIEYLEK